MNDVQIRKLDDTADDRALLEQFDAKLAVYEKTLDRRLVKSEKIVYNNPAHVFKSGECAVFVAELSDKPVGYIVGKVKKSLPWFGGSPYGYIETMFVDDQCRKAGIATALFSKLKEWFGERNIKTFQLRVFSNNDRAIALYKKWGFKTHVVEMILDPEGEQ